jgi:glutamate racemase
MTRAKILVFDSGLGGLSVYRAVEALRPDADYFYLGDDALFPYGALEPEVLIARVLEVIDAAMRDFEPDCIIIACHTASTLVLPHLRALYAMPVIGTVPAIKPAVALTKTGLISVLATPGTVSRDYTQTLIDDFASGVDVTLVGAKRLAALAEAMLHGQSVDDAAILAEIAPAFVQHGEKRTDVIVLACTHYPLLMDDLMRLAPWPVTFIDPAPAIARRVVQLLGPGGPGRGPSGPGRGQTRLHFTAGMAHDAGSLARLLPGKITLARSCGNAL